jgi:hypothetical protein
MASSYIICNDNVGLSCNQNCTQMTFYVPTNNTKDDNKFIKACLEKIIEMYNPKEPYFFCSKDIAKAIRIGQKTNRDNTIYIDLWPSFNYRIFKLKFTGIIEQPIHFICSSSDLVNDLISKIKKKYKNISNGMLKYKDAILESNVPLDKYNFMTGNFSCNEIVFESVEKKTLVNKESKEKEVKTDKPKIKKTKEKIPLPVKNTLWAKFFGENINGVCQCCKTTPIHLTNFDCGHIISEKNGGNVHLDNLRPICRTCNSSMGIQNMNEYMIKYGFDKI